LFSTLELRKRNIVYIRAMLTLIILVLAAMNLGDILETRQYIVVYMAFLVASNFVFMYMPLNLYAGTKLQYIIFMLDIIFLTLGAYWLAYLDFPFFIVVFFTILISAMSQSVKMSLVIAVAVNALYIYMKSSGAGTGDEALAQPNFYLNVPFIFIVALHSSYLAEKANEDESEQKRLVKANQMLSGQIKNMTAEMESAMDFMELLYDSFRDGLIVLNEGGIIRQFNKRCESIFQIKKSKAINLMYMEVKELGGVQALIAELKMKKFPAFDREIRVEAGGSNKLLVVNTSFIRDKSDNVIGMIVNLRQKLENLTGELK
jgi:PAS domain-containing protein